MRDHLLSHMPIEERDDAEGPGESKPRGQARFSRWFRPWMCLLVARLGTCRIAAMNWKHAVSPRTSRPACVLPNIERDSGTILYMLQLWLLQKNFRIPRRLRVLVANGDRLFPRRESRVRLLRFSPIGDLNDPICSLLETHSESIRSGLPDADRLLARARYSTGDEKPLSELPDRCQWC